MNERRKRGALWALVIVSCFPIALIVSFPQKISLASVSMYCSVLAGYIGIVLLLWMYMLGAKSMIGLVFRDIAPILSIHKKIGKYGSLFFLLHPIFIVYGYSESLLYTIIPSVGTAFERHITLGRISFMLILIIWVSSVLLKNKMKFRPWKYIHYFAYISLPFALLHVPDIGSQYTGHLIVKLYFFSIVGLFAIFSAIRIAGWLNLDRRAYTVVAHQQITKLDYVITLRPINRPITPRLGQYIYIKLGIVSEDHPFSIAYYDRNTRDISIAYRVFGSFTRTLSKTPVGQNVSLAGPYGSFMSDLPSESAQPVVYLAGGIGITPFAQRVTDERLTRVQFLFAANRNRASAVLVPGLKQLIGDRLISIYNDEAADTPLGPQEERGFITAELITRYVLYPQLYVYYLCGPPPFVHKMQEALQSLGVPKRNIEMERFSW